MSLETAYRYGHQTGINSVPSSPKPPLIGSHCPLLLSDVLSNLSVTVGVGLSRTQSDSV